MGKPHMSWAVLAVAALTGCGQPTATNGSETEPRLELAPLPEPAPIADSPWNGAPGGPTLANFGADSCVVGEPQPFLRPTVNNLGLARVGEAVLVAAQPTVADHALVARWADGEWSEPIQTSLSTGVRSRRERQPLEVSPPGSGAVLLTTSLERASLSVVGVGVEADGASHGDLVTIPLGRSYTGRLAVADVDDDVYVAAGGVGAPVALHRWRWTEEGVEAEKLAEFTRGMPLALAATADRHAVVIRRGERLLVHVGEAEPYVLPNGSELDVRLVEDGVEVRYWDAGRPYIARTSDAAEDRTLPAAPLPSALPDRLSSAQPLRIRWRPTPDGRRFEIARLSASTWRSAAPPVSLFESSNYVASRHSLRRPLFGETAWLGDRLFVVWSDQFETRAQLVDCSGESAAERAEPSTDPSE